MNAQDATPPHRVTYLSAETAHRCYNLLAILLRMLLPLLVPVGRRHVGGLREQGHRWRRFVPLLLQQLSLSTNRFAGRSASVTRTVAGAPDAPPPVVGSRRRSRSHAPPASAISAIAAAPATATTAFSSPSARKLATSIAVVCRGRCSFTTAAAAAAAAGTLLLPGFSRFPRHGTVAARVR